MSKSHRLIFGRVTMLVFPVMLLAGSAVARGTADEAPSVTVRYGDLNLNGPEGVANLYARIHAAAVSVCKASEVSPLLQRAFPTAGDCVSHAVARAVRKVHNDNLNAYHSQIRRGKHHRILVAAAETAR